eukprot:GHVU01199893.1.p4 GENE.GHVU01199893.1~~GHVU01199893.1.p4  ORF type:complete len:117 (+),score=15.20 GHVU01199893.1:875-1225(+)
MPPLPSFTRPCRPFPPSHARAAPSLPPSLCLSADLCPEFAALRLLLREEVRGAEEVYRRAVAVREFAPRLQGGRRISGEERLEMVLDGLGGDGAGFAEAQTERPDVPESSLYRLSR